MADCGHGRPFLTLTGLGNVLIASQHARDPGHGWMMFAAGFLIMLYMFFGWFGTVAKESMAGLYSPQMDRSFRWGMSWFIFSEVMFFAAFFGALFYSRFLGVPWLGGDGDGAPNVLIWPDFKAAWPLMSNPNPETFPGPSATIDPWHIPLINTFLLLASSVTVTIAHHAVKKIIAHKSSSGLLRPSYWVRFFWGFRSMSMSSHTMSSI